MAPTESSALQRDDAPDASNRNWHALDAGAALAAMRSGADGLTEDEASRRLVTFGFNRLPTKAERSALLRFALQFHNLLIYVLLAAGVLAGAIGHVTDAMVIVGVVLINAVIGFVQEG